MEGMEDVFRTRSLGVATEGIPDQYADGKAAKLWEIYIGDKNVRTQTYRDFFGKTLRENGCRHILDVACGTGVDSIMLLEQGFKVTSVDASDKMLKYALKERWNRRKEPGFDQWVIDEANWLTLPNDIHKPGDGYDSVICLGNSFAHLPDFSGDLQDIRTALKNFASMIKPGGILIIDHRNYDYILDNKGKAPAKNIYYNSKNVKKINTSVLLTDGEPKLVILDYTIDISDRNGVNGQFDPLTDTEVTKRGRYCGEPVNMFRLSYYPHRLEQFTALIKEAFGPDCTHRVYGDFKLGTDANNPPAFYIHVVIKGKQAEKR